MDRRLPGLDPEERLVAHAPVSFRGAAATSIRSTFSFGPARRRLEAYEHWRSHAAGAGLTTSGPEMILGVTDTRLVVWSTTFWMSRPDALIGKIPLAKVGTIATTRHGMVTGLAVALVDGQIVEVEAVRGRRLRKLARALQNLTH